MIEKLVQQWTYHTQSLYILSIDMVNIFNKIKVLIDKIEELEHRLRIIEDPTNDY